MSEHRRRYASRYAGATRYHTSRTCVGLNSTELANSGLDSTPEVTLDEIRQRSLTPCKVCMPSPLFRVLTSPQLAESS